MTVRHVSQNSPWAASTYRENYPTIPIDHYPKLQIPNPSITSLTGPLQAKPLFPKVKLITQARTDSHSTTHPTMPRIEEWLANFPTPQKPQMDPTSEPADTTDMEIMLQSLQEVFERYRVEAHRAAAREKFEAASEMGKASNAVKEDLEVFKDECDDLTKRIADAVTCFNKAPTDAPQPPLRPVAEVIQEHARVLRKIATYKDKSHEAIRFFVEKGDEYPSDVEAQAKRIRQDFKIYERSFAPLRGNLIREVLTFDVPNAATRESGSDTRQADTPKSNTCESSVLPTEQNFRRALFSFESAYPSGRSNKSDSKVTLPKFSFYSSGSHYSDKFAMSKVTLPRLSRYSSGSGRSDKSATSKVTIPTAHNHW